MTRFLYWIVELISKVHTLIMKLNDTYEYELTDKQLHFLVIGALGIALIFAVYPIFKYLAKKNHILTITGIYVFTLIVVITFAIEIGQKITNTGNMEFADVLFRYYWFCDNVYMFSSNSWLFQVYSKLF